MRLKLKIQNKNEIFRICELLVYETNFLVWLALHKTLENENAKVINFSFYISSLLY